MLYSDIECVGGVGHVCDVLVVLQVKALVAKAYDSTLQLLTEKRAEVQKVGAARRLWNGSEEKGVYIPIQWCGNAAYVSVIRFRYISV